MPLQPENLKELGVRFGLSYHTNYLYEAERSAGLSGHRVLEVGGSLPRGLVIDELGAEQWWGVEDFDYWNSLPVNGGGTRPNRIPTLTLNEIRSADDMADHGVLLGKIEEFPSNLNGHFTRVFSIACFEHIHRLALALDSMYAALAPGGLLFTMFSPIWSAFDGHHIPNITDEEGRLWTKKDSPIPPWGHLLLSPPEMDNYLRKKMDSRTASEIVYHIYCNPHINRYKTEDYGRFIRQSPFEVVSMVASFPTPISEKIQKHLETKFSGYKNFNNNGIAAVLKKTA